MPWYVAHTNARAEWMAHKELRRKGFDTLYLHYRSTIKHARKVIGVLKPYFPRYVFVKVDGGQAFGHVNRAAGVATVINGPGGPLEIPPDVIDELASRANAAGLVDVPDPKHRERMLAGRMVRIMGGPLEGLIAQVALDEGERVRVWLEMFGGNVEAVLDPTGLNLLAPEWTSIDPILVNWGRRRRR
jgi:transcriptional antiterminator RfaH